MGYSRINLPCVKADKVCNCLNEQTGYYGACTEIVVRLPKLGKSLFDQPDPSDFDAGTYDDMALLDLSDDKDHEWPTAEELEGREISEIPLDTIERHLRKIDEWGLRKAEEWGLEYATPEQHLTEHKAFAQTLKDSGNRQEFETGAVRDVSEGKGYFHLLPYEGLERVAKIFEAGSRKYGDRNWERGIPMKNFVNSGGRHLAKAASGRTDEDHLAMAAWNLLCALATEERIKDGTLPESLAYSTKPE